MSLDFKNATSTSTAIVLPAQQPKTRYSLIHKIGGGFLVFTFFSALVAVIFVTPTAKQPPSSAEAALPAPPVTLDAVQKVDYVIDGVYPGMSAAQAKTAGFSECRPATADEAVCTRPTTAKEIFGIPAKSVEAIFEKPYTKIREVRVTFDTRKNDKSCTKKSGQWADIIPLGCGHDIAAEITNLYGQPIAKNRWHRCGRYSMSLESHVNLLHVTDDPSQIDYRKYECEQAQKLRREQEDAAKISNDFIKKMK